jgi:hypothetical protein
MSLINSSGWWNNVIGPTSPLYERPLLYRIAESCFSFLFKIRIPFLQECIISLLGLVIYNFCNNKREKETTNIELHANTCDVSVSNISIRYLSFVIFIDNTTFAIITKNLWALKYHTLSIDLLQLIFSKHSAPSCIYHSHLLHSAASPRFVLLNSLCSQYSYVFCYTEPAGFVRVVSDLYEFYTWVVAPSQNCLKSTEQLRHIPRTAQACLGLIPGLMSWMGNQPTKRLGVESWANHKTILPAQGRIAGTEQCLTAWGYAQADGFCCLGWRSWRVHNMGCCYCW